MKLQMINTCQDELVLDADGKTLTEVICVAIQAHTNVFGEEYLFELLQGIAEMVSEEKNEYKREDFSDPECNFTLKLIE